MVEPQNQTASSAPVTVYATVNRSVFMRAITPMLILALGAVAYWGLSKYLRKEPDRGAEGVAAPRVQVAPVRAHEGGMTLKADGVVVPYREIDLAAEVAGRIVERSDVCRAGNYVTKGTLLARIDPQDYRLEKERLEEERRQAIVSIEELEEEILGATSLLEIADKQVELRGKELARMQRLGGAVSTTELETAEAAELTARHALLTLKNQIRLLKIRQGRLVAVRDLVASKLAKAELDLARTEIFAPVDGVIVSDQIEEDAFVQRGAPLLTIEDTAKVEVRCKLAMEDLYWLWDRKSNSADASAAASPGDAYGIPETNVQIIYRLAGRDSLQYVWEGRLSRYDGIGLDEKTRTVPCRVVVDDPGQRVSTHTSGPPVLVRGMYVSVEIQVDPRTPLLKVPELALQPGNVTWRVREGKLAIVPVSFVTLLETDAQERKTVRDALIYVEDPSRLGPGDHVVTSPLTFVRTGMDVQIAAEQSE
ncbi:MAG: efflux RND transporter periplasmic adaptor subunit [Pirellulaceae bacterium]